MKYEITFISGYEPITIETNEIIDKGNIYYFECTDRIRDKDVVFKYEISKKKILNIKER